VEDKHWERNAQVRDQKLWQTQLAIINLMRNHMVLVIKDNNLACMTLGVYDVAFLIEKCGQDVFFNQLIKN
jgi:hypothetical protein